MNIISSLTTRTDENAFWDPERNQMVFGDGDTFLHRFVNCIDVIGHELTVSGDDDDDGDELATTLFSKTFGTSGNAKTYLEKSSTPSPSTRAPWNIRASLARSTSTSRTSLAS